MMRILILSFILSLSLTLGMSARAQDEGVTTDAIAVPEQLPAQESFLDKAGDWWATFGKTPEETQRIMDERRAQRAVQPDAAVSAETVKAKIEQSAEQLKQEAKAKIEEARNKVKQEAPHIQEKVKAKVKEKADQKADEMKKNAQAKLDAKKHQLMKKADKKTMGLLSDLMK